MSKKRDIEPTNDKGQKHGLWEFYYHGGRLMFKGFYHNGKEFGYEEWFFSKGLTDEKKYHI
jgi:antitoxin component YwqK of YwqJK toxin-antitoxin module